MELEEALAFVRPRHQGVLVTIRREGRPQLSNIVYAVADDGAVEISVTDTRAKTANLRRDPRASLYVLGDHFYAYAVLESTAEVSPAAAAPDDGVVDALVALYRRVGGEHPDWAEYRQAMVSDRRVLLRLRPERAYGLLGPG